MVGENIKELAEREPIIRQTSNRITDRAHNLRDKPDKALEKNVPEFENRNFGGGRGVGVVGAAVATIIEDTVGLPFGASSDIVNSEVVEDGSTVYTVNVNAPFEKMAEARASLDSTTGFLSFVTDEVDVEGIEIQKTRVLRDTFQIEVKVID